MEVAACRAIGECPPGQAVVTAGFALAARYIIHTVGPVWRGGREGEADILASCYRNALAVADEVGARSVAFPAISTGVSGALMIGDVLGKGADGFFAAGRLRFGEDVFASDVLAKLMDIEGVENVCLIRFKRVGRDSPDMSEAGRSDVFMSRCFTWLASERRISPISTSWNSCPSTRVW